jgi:hypothetical protein
MWQTKARIDQHSKSLIIARFMKHEIQFERRALMIITGVHIAGLYHSVRPTYVQFIAYLT